MKRPFLLIVFVFVCFGAISQGINFEGNNSLNDALIKARKENKFVFIDFYTPWCAPCKMMARNIFPLEEVGDFYNAHFVNLTLNADAKENADIVNKYVITSFPNFVFLDSTGEIIHRAMDAMSEEEFIKLGKTAIDFSNNYKAITEKIKNGDRSPEMLEKYFEFIPYSDVKEKLAIEYLDKLSGDEKLSNTAWIFFRDYVTDTKCESFVFFTKNSQLFIDRFGKEKVENKMVNMLQHSYNTDKSYFQSLKKYNLTFYNEVELKLKHTQS